MTINVPGGSNNDADPWYGAPTATPQQTTRPRNRTGADLRWLDRAFAIAGSRRAPVRRGHGPGRHVGPRRQDAGHLTNYEPIVTSLATHTVAVRQAGAAAQR